MPDHSGHNTHDDLSNVRLDLLAAARDVIAHKIGVVQACMVMLPLLCKLGLDDEDDFLDFVAVHSECDYMIFGGGKLSPELQERQYKHMAECEIDYKDGIHDACRKLLRYAEKWKVQSIELEFHGPMIGSIYFYATRNDLLELVALLEKEHNVNYVRPGNYLSSEPIVRLNSLQGADLGISRAAYSDNPAYLVFPSGADIIPHVVDHGYFIDTRSVYGSFFLRPGGQHGDNLLIESQMFNEFPGFHLARYFVEQIKARATKFGHAYVFGEAEQLYDQGWRLVRTSNDTGLVRQAPPIKYETKGNRLSYLESCQYLLKHDIDDCHWLFVQGWDGESEPPMQNTRPSPHDNHPCGINFFKTRLEGERNKKIRLENLTLPRTYINRTGLVRVSFARSDLSESFMCWNDFENCDFTEADLSGCDMRASFFFQMQIQQCESSRC